MSFLSKLKARLRRQPEPENQPPMSNQLPKKNPFESTTIWGAVVIAVGFVARKAGLEVSNDQLTGVINLLSANWTTISDTIGLLLVIWGRFKATQPLGFK
jgi:hypothetical protein